MYLAYNTWLNCCVCFFYLTSAVTSIFQSPTEVIIRARAKEHGLPGCSWTTEGSTWGKVKFTKKKGRDLFLTKDAICVTGHNCDDAQTPENGRLPPSTAKPFSVLRLPPSALSSHLFSFTLEGRRFHPVPTIIQPPTENKPSLAPFFLFCLFFWFYPSSLLRISFAATRDRPRNDIYFQPVQIVTSTTTSTPVDNNKVSTAYEVHPTPACSDGLDWGGDPAVSQHTL